MFTKNDLKTGMFGVMRNGNKFVIVNDRIIYQNDGYDNVNDLNDDFVLFGGTVEKVYDKCYSFRHLEKLLEGSAFTGADLVYDRKRDTKKLYNGKVVCIDLNDSNYGDYTVGKIYQFADGKLTNDNGRELPYGTDIYSFRDWEQFSCSKWIEIKE